MRTQLSHSDRRVLIGGAGLIVLLFVGVKGVPAFVTFTSDLRAQASSTLAEARRTEVDVLALSIVREDSALLDSNLALLRPRFIAAPGAAPLLARAAALVAMLADSAPMLVRELRLVSVDSSALPVLRVRVLVSAETDVNGLATFLRSTESGGALAQVRRLRVEAPGVASSADRRELLRVEGVIDFLGLLTRDPP